MGLAVKDSPIAAAKAELLKLRAKVNGAQSTLNGLRSKGVVAKKEFGAKEIAEKNAHIEAKERKAADTLVAPAVAKMEELESSVKALAAAAEPLTSLKGAEVEAFATPISVVEATEKLMDSIDKCMEEAKKAVTEQQAELP